ncbi:tape measure protein [Pseudomonas sp.]|uniref:tape measure protein n=1 Tax=Pseudomonas sp. TaxID=306 RepID=UPI0027316FE9|nr:tape measure protein [Pseudomonas sp.]MDP2444159.1 tape measure protein [Pseudomonas sp.]MDZ4337115.1 tape measure protein [Pseudomonas sp.]
MSLKDRLIQFVLRGKDELSPEAAKSAEALASVSAEAEELGKVLDSAKDARGLARGLETTQRAAERAESSLVQADLQIKELRDALNKAPGSAGLEQSLKDAEREARRMQRGLDSLRKSLADQEKAAQAAGIDTNNLADEEKRLAAEVDRAKVALDANSQQLRVLQREHAAAGRAAAEQATRVDGAREAMSRGAKQVLAFAAAYISLNAAFGLVQKGLNLVRDGIYSMLQTGDQFELLDKRLASLMGSVAGGEQATAWIKKFAKDTPLEVADVTEAFALLKTYGLDPMDGSLQAIVDKNEQLGGGMERLQGIASALGQAYGKQKLQTEEILQLVERGVPVWGMLEKITGKNAAQLSKLATEGRLGRDVIKALVAEIGRSAEGAAADGMNTLTGKVSNLKDVWADFQNRVAESGALDFAKKKLGELAAKIDEMDKDGRLDKLATALSKAFTEGAQKAQDFAVKLLEIDFNKLADDSTKWLDGFGKGVDGALARFEVFSTTTRGFFNLLTAASSGADTLFATVKLGILEVAGLLANVLPESIGGAKFKSAVEGAAATVRASLKTSIDGVKTDAEDLADVLGGIGQSAADASKAAAEGQTALVKTQLEQQRMLDQAHADQLIANQDKVKDAALAAAASGTAAITDIGNAINLIDTARSVQQLEGLRGALVTAFDGGRLTQEQFAQAAGLLNTKLSELGGTAKGAADGVSELEEKLGDLAQVQAAISNAKTDVDINSIRAALRKLYNDGEITAAQYNAELKKTSDRQKELKSAVEQGSKAQATKNAVDKEAIVTSEQLRRESGARMEAERKASGEAMEATRKGSEEAKRDMSSTADFFSGVISRAREPLAAMSEAALAVYDRLRGISSVDMSIDTSSLEATSESLQKVVNALGEVEAAASRPLTSSLGRWALESQAASLQTQQAFLSQKAALQGLTEGYARNDISAQQFVRRAQDMRQQLGLLDDADLSALDASIAAAQQSMQQLGSSTRATLEGLQDELDTLQGRTDDIERRRFAARRRELEGQMAEAQAGGNADAVANAARAIGLLREIETQTGQQRQKQEQQKRIDEQQKAAPAAQQQAAPTKVIRLETAQGKAVNVAVNSDRDEATLLDILEDAALRSV